MGLPSYRTTSQTVGTNILPDLDHTGRRAVDSAFPGGGTALVGLSTPRGRGCAQRSPNPASDSERGNAGAARQRSWRYGGRLWPTGCWCSLVTAPGDSEEARSVLRGGGGTAPGGGRSGHRGAATARSCGERRNLGRSSPRPATGDPKKTGYWPR